MKYLFAILSLAASSGFSQWNFVGKAGFSPFQADFISIAINPTSNEPYVVFKDHHNYGKASVMKFAGNGWIYVGSPGFSDGYVSCNSIAFDKQGTPFVAFTDWENDYKATVMKFDGSSWVAVGNKGISAAAASFESIAIDSKGFPYVAYRDVQQGYKASVLKFDGIKWNYIGIPGFSTPAPYPYGAAYISVVLDNNDVPYVGYSDDVNYGRATVQKFNGTDWESVGSPSFAGYNSQYSRSMAIDSKNRPYIVCQQNGRVTVMRFEKGTWSPVGNPSFSQGGAEYACIAVDKDDNPYVAYQDYGVTRRLSVMKLKGVEWVYVGDQGFTSSSVQFVTMTADNQGGVYVAFADNSTPSWFATAMKFENKSTGFIEPSAKNQDISVYPNPSGSIFTVCYSGEKKELSINLKNQLGQTITSKQFSQQSALKETFDLTGYGKGVYFIEVDAGESREVRKVILQ